MKVDFELMAVDLVAFNEFQNGQLIRRERFGCAIVGFLILITPAVLILMTLKRPPLQLALDIWPLILGLILWLPFIFHFYNWCSRRRAHSMTKERANQGYFGPCSLSIHPDGLFGEKPNFETKLKWSGITKIVETDDHAFICTSGWEVFVLPKRAFAVQTQFQEFVSQIADRASVVPETR